MASPLPEEICQLTQNTMLKVQKERKGIASRKG